MKIYDLLFHESQSVSQPQPLLDPIHEDNALLEATLLDILHYAFLSTTALLMDLRTSMYFGQGNTGVIICRGVSEISLKQNFKQRVWMIGDSHISNLEKGLELLFPMASGGIKICAEKIEFYEGNVHNISEVGSSLDDGITGYLQTTPHWDSEFEILATSSRA